jgi:hypothetical protein
MPMYKKMMPKSNHYFPKYGGVDGGKNFKNKKSFFPRPRGCGKKI